MAGPVRCLNLLPLPVALLALLMRGLLTSPLIPAMISASERFVAPELSVLSIDVPCVHRRFRFFLSSQLTFFGRTSEESRTEDAYKRAEDQRETKVQKTKVEICTRVAPKNARNKRNLARKEEMIS